MIAHIRKDGTEQTNSEHCKCVAQYAGKRGKRVGLEKLMYLAGLLHDLGKSKEEFEQYIRSAHIDKNSVRRGQVNHSSAGAKYIHDTFFKLPEVRQITSQLLSFCIAYHHGIGDVITPDGVDTLENRVNPKDEIYYEESLNKAKETFLCDEDLSQLFQEAENEVKKILECANTIADQIEAVKEKASNKTREESYRFILGCVQRLILSILIDSDYTDTTEFTNDTVIPYGMSPEVRKQFWEIMGRRLDKRLAEFKGTDQISSLRKGISEECFSFAANDSGVYCLAIPTGGGKTFSSFRYAIEHSRIFNKERIIYIAPYLSILEQNASEVRSALFPDKKDSNDDKNVDDDLFWDPDEYFLEHHSNVVMDSKEDKDEFDEKELKRRSLTDNWDCPLIFTTLVRFLNVLFDESKQDIRRMHQLANSVIIVDEIQSLPIKCVHIFNAMINFLSSACGATVVLCSATQPLLDSTERPILYKAPTDIAKDSQVLFDQFKRTKVVFKMKPGGYDKEELFQFVSDKLTEVDNILIILNTKLAVREFHAYVKSQMEEHSFDDFELTTLMCPEHRSKVLNTIKNEYLKRDGGKKSPKRKMICISTQLIEAGVDVSFQCVIRSLAGMDSIAQAAGRCNRNGEQEIGYVYVLYYQEESLNKLEDIRKSQRATYDVLDEYDLAGNSEEFDPLSIEVMDAYYDYYFFNRKTEMDYNLGENTGLKIFDLLALNKVGVDEMKYRSAKKPEFVMHQAFKAAGHAFEVIPNNTVGVIVPYEGAADLIEGLRNSRDIKDIRKYLRQLQRYTVNLFIGGKELNELRARKAIDESVLDGNVKILVEGFYDKYIGIISELENLVF